MARVDGEVPAPFVDEVVVLVAHRSEVVDVGVSVVAVSADVVDLAVVVGDGAAGDSTVAVDGA